MKRILIPLAIALVLTAGACGVDDSDAVDVGTAPVAEQPTSTTVAPGQGVQVTIYFVQEGLIPATRTVPPGSDQAVAGEAVRALLAGTTAGEQSGGFRTEIPGDTRLLGLTIGDDRVATVDLSREFEAGSDSLSIRLRLGQVVCTVDNVVDGDIVDGTRFLLDGTPVKVFSRAGISLDQPLHCTDFDGFFR